MSICHQGSGALEPESGKRNLGGALRLRRERLDGGGKREQLCVQEGFRKVVIQLFNLLLFLYLGKDIVFPVIVGAAAKGFCFIPDALFAVFSTAFTVLFEDKGRRLQRLLPPTREINILLATIGVGSDEFRQIHHQSPEKITTTR